MNYFTLVVTLIEIVKLVESLIPDKGQGETKLALARQLVEQAVGDVAAIWPQLEALVAAFVKLANLAGTFKK